MTKPIKKRSNPLIVFFYIFIAVLIVFFVIITLKIALSPICTADAQHVCVIDSWSIAGITAAVFGIAATLLTFLAAVAVAYWWTNLDERVEIRTNALVEQGLQVQEAKFQEQIADNVKIFEAKIADTVKAFETQTSQLEASLHTTNKEIILAITKSLDPWDIEDWANDLLLANHSSEVAIRMVLSYLKEVDALPLDPIPHPRRKTLHFTPSDDILYYWAKVLEWQEKVKEQKTQNYTDMVEREIGKRKPKIEEYKKQEAGKKA